MATNQQTAKELDRQSTRLRLSVESKNTVELMSEEIQDLCNLLDEARQIIEEGF